MDIILKKVNDPLILISDYVEFASGKEKEDNIFSM